MSEPKKIIIIDDSLLVRNIIGDIISTEPDLHVIATGKTGMDCIDLAVKLKPDLIILDIEMPILDGLSALDELKKLNLKIPVIILSVLAQHGADATFKALEKGAIDFVPKPSAQIKLDPKELGKVLISKIRGYFEVIGIESFKNKRFESDSRIKFSQNKTFQNFDKIEAICIGTSTGGPKALLSVLSGFPKDFSIPIFVVQHMPAGFTKAFADRLNTLTNLEVKEAEDWDLVRPGLVLIAPGDYHMILMKKGGQAYINLKQSEQINGHRPSIEALFESVKDVYNSKHIIAVIMTGMGKDGAESIKAIREQGGTTIAQDEESSVIFGMNRQAIELGGIDKVLSLDDITKNILDIVKQRG